MLDKKKFLDHLYEERDQLLRQMDEAETLSANRAAALFDARADTIQKIIDKVEQGKFER